MKIDFSRWNWNRIALHVFFWITYLALNAVIVCVTQGIPVAQGFWATITSEVVGLPVKLVYIYFIFYVIIPQYLERSKLLQLLLYTVTGFFATLFVYRAVLTYVYAPVFQPNVKIDFFNGPGIFIAMFDIFITLVAATTVKMIRVHYSTLEFERELIREKLQSELNFLRTQTNPHFLFNTLNNIYVLARKKSDLTPEAIMMLSKVMRFLLYDCRSQRIPVSSEVKAIRDYIEIEKLRYSSRLTVYCTEEMDNPGALISPLLLLPFVENSFKYGADTTTGQAEIDIQIKLVDNHMKFTVTNTVDPEARRPDNTGIGLQNVSRQLDLLYPEAYSLKTGANGDRYKAVLKISLDKYEPADHRGIV